MIQILGGVLAILAICYLPVLIAALIALAWDILCAIGRGLRDEFLVAFGQKRG